MLPRRLAAALSFCAVATASAAARADDVAAAQVLFDEGRRLLVAHDYEAACPKLAESQRLAPAIGTEFNLADCWEHVGKLASAWAAFVEVVDSTHRRGEVEREQAARARVAALEPRLGRLTIDVPESRRVPDLEVMRDGERVQGALWGVAVPVDAGEHKVEAHAPGRRPWSGVVRTTDGATGSITMPELALAPAPPPSPAPAPAAAPPPPPPPSRAIVPATPDHTGALLVLGGAVVLAGVGVVGLVEHGAEVNSYNDDSTCPAISAPNRPAHCNDYVNAASTWSTVAAVSFVASGIALAGGVTLWLLAPRPSPPGAAGAPTLSCAPGPASLACAGTF